LAPEPLGLLSSSIAAKKEKQPLIIPSLRSRICQRW
jgi:hypothetical protein